MDDLSGIFEAFVFKEKGKLEHLSEKLLRVRERTNNKFHPHMVLNLGLQLQATLFGGECSQLCMCPPDSPPSYPSPIKSNVNAY